MSTRQYLYDNFENFDKPTEDDFKVLIDWAGAPTTFLNITIPKYTDIITDINTHTFILDVRVTYLVEYDVEVYILYGLEGTYGLGGTYIDYDNLSFVGNKGDGTLTQNLIVNTTIPGAGITAGDVFPAGTGFEDIFRALLIDNIISDLSYTADLPAEFVKVGDTVNITKFTWSIDGAPINLNLSDSDGQYNSPVTGNQITVSEAYTYSSFKELTWTLTSSNADSTLRTTHWVETTYYGTNTTGIIPDQTEILAGAELLVLTDDYVDVTLNTIISEYGWIAVESIQTNKVYSVWEISAFNTSLIGATEFIKYAGDVVVSGSTYNVYMFTYKSQVTNIKLY